MESGCRREEKQQIKNNSSAKVRVFFCWSQVRFQEAVDRMLGQIVRRLWEAERPEARPKAAAAGPLQGGGRRAVFTLVITGDHSTPVSFGDHSHEPVPFCIARLEHVVSIVCIVPGVIHPSIHPSIHPLWLMSCGKLFVCAVSFRFVVTVYVVCA